VVSNDINAYASVLARCYVQSDSERWLKTATREINSLASIAPAAGYFTETFCEKSRFFHPDNGAKIDAIREEIAKRSYEPELESILLVSLMEAADRVDSTTGVQMAYLKKWAPRALNQLELRVPQLLPRAICGQGVSLRQDAAIAAAEGADVAYLDPPYNQHSYLGNYHVWETLVLWDKPAVYGVACKRIDVRERQSAYNSKRKIEPEMRLVLSRLRAKHAVVSYSNEGYISRQSLEEMLREIYCPKGDVKVLAYDFKRYVGAQIGIHNLQGQKVGRVSHVRNVEYLFVAAKDGFAKELSGILGQNSTQLEMY
jgi:adenine-specific DNA-methyltransferase